jgi:hypothetical protein
MKSTRHSLASEKDQQTVRSELRKGVREISVILIRSHTKQVVDEGLSGTDDPQS